MGQGALSGLQDVLSASEQKVFIRAALHSGQRAVRYLDVTVGPPSEPPGWKAVPVVLTKDPTDMRLSCVDVEPAPR